MTRRCSHCSNNGHNSRTCPNRGVKIFGVRFDGVGSIRKSASMGNLSYYGGVGGGGSTAAASEGRDEREKDGYASEDFGKGRDRKKGVAWTEEEHKMFLLGLHQLGKGDWRGIARKYVVSRTATQVASHAQKYFMRQSHANRRKRRSSLFDMVPEELGNDQSFPMCNEEPETETINPEAEDESMNSNPAVDVSRNDPKPEAMLYPCAMIYPPYTPFFPFSYPYMACYKTDATATSKPHSVVKPTAVHSTSPINVDELVGMSKLTINAGESRTSSSMPINLLGGGPQRHSAFHANNPGSGGSRMNLSSSPPIHAM